MISIKLLVYDFDGVMTDNKVFVDQHGNEMVQVNRADGLGISEIRKLGTSCGPVPKMDHLLKNK